MFELYLIRHGKTYANEKNLYCGITDLSLSRAGKREIRKNKGNGLYTACDGLYSSGMARCNETLKIIWGKDVSFEEIDLLKEINVGIFEMKSYEELKAVREYQMWINDTTGDYKPVGGESKNMFYRRISMGLLGLTERIMRNEYATAMCVTHGGVIVAIMQGLFGNLKNFYQWQPEPGLGYRLTHEGGLGYTGFEPVGTGNNHWK